MRTVARALFSTVIVAAPIAAAAQQASDADLARFRTAYTSGEGLAYVVINLTFPPVTIGEQARLVVVEL